LRYRGAPNDDDAGSNSGAAYVFARDGSSWNQQAKLTASDAAGGDLFGLAVAIDGDYAVIGAYGNSDAGNLSGSAYIFKRTGTAWSQEAKLTASDAAAADFFGAAVAIGGDAVAIGAYGDDDGAFNAGSTYIFRRSGASWSQEAKLTAPDPAADDGFGFSLGISGDDLFVGAPWDDDRGSTSGSAYVFRKTPAAGS